MLESWTTRGVIDAIDEMLRKRNSFLTPRQDKPFVARAKGDGVEVVNSRGKARQIQERDFVGVVNLLRKSAEVRVMTFQQVTYHASYILALIIAATGDEALRAQVQQSWDAEE